MVCEVKLCIFFNIFFTRLYKYLFFKTSQVVTIFVVERLRYIQSRAIFEFIFFWGQKIVGVNWRLASKMVGAINEWS